ncbi:50S ribosomal protein L13 [Candidatus Pacearchaeota archaeon CG10_big_fil_rev_8_21_14_0_10_35_13]|nr:MAG: 50S ribosomal protein L13 [Candidatus Pacearchaeota archaeon CG10_big_fil_rev_8_21_14_0_10_35_13]
MTEEKIIVIDAENATAGRLASYVAKQILLGKKVAVINAEKAIITGNKKDTEEKYLNLRRKGGSAMRGPFFPSNPERILKRIINGMLPKKSMRGFEAIKRVKCYNGVPREFENADKIKSGKNKATSKKITIKELGGKLKP